MQTDGGQMKLEVLDVKITMHGPKKRSFTDFTKQSKVAKCLKRWFQADLYIRTDYFVQFRIQKRKHLAVVIIESHPKSVL